jgi:iron complex outermembrane receptor protein
MNIKTKRCTRPLLLAAVISAINAGYVIAEPGAIEEVTVTAQKRSENLQDIPLAITAFSGDQIREDGIASVADLGSRTPGLVFSAFSVGQPEIAIRGIGTKEDGAAASDSTVISVDDVYIAARTAQVFDIFDLERVEILRGPQGTLYGKNSIGGSINFVTSTPTEELTGRARVTSGENGRLDFGAMISGGLTDNLLGKISFSQRNYDGHTKNVHNGKTMDDIDTLAWRGQLLWKASDNLEFLFTADGADDTIGDTNREPVGSAGDSVDNNANNPLAVNAAFGGAGDPFTSANDEVGFTEREVEGYALKISWDLQNMTFTSITSVRSSDFDWAEDSEGLPGLSSFNPAVDPSFGFRRDVTDSAIEETDQFTQEFRLTSSGDGSIDWVTGVFYSEEEIDRTETFCIPNCGGNVLAVQYPPGQTRVADRFIVNSSIQSNESTSWAVYGQSTFRIRDDLSITAGLRYSYEEKDVALGGEVDQGVVPVGVFIQENFAITASDDWDNVSGRLAVDWNFSEDAMLYGSVSTGFKSGGFIGSPSTPERASNSFDEETAINYEMGLKSTWLESTLRLNVAVFYTDYQDLQVTRFTQLADNPTNGFGEFITENAAEADITGLEVEFTWMATDSLEFGGSYAYLDAEYKDFTPDVANLAPGAGTLACAAGSTPVSADPADGCIPDFAGNTLRQAPENMFNLYGRQTFDLGNAGEIIAKLEYRYQDDSFYDPSNNAITVIPSYDMWDALVAWNSVDKNWRVTAWVKNLADEEYRTHIYSQRSAQIAFATFGAPRTSGVTVEYSF